MSLSRALVAFHLTNALANKGVYVESTEVIAYTDFYRLVVTLTNGKEVVLSTRMTETEIHSEVYHATKGAK